MQVTECVERALSRYGSTTARVVIWNFENSYKLHKEDIVRYPEEFVQSLNKMFGIGSHLIEKAIAQEIQSIYGLDYNDAQNLVTVLREVRSQSRRMVEH